jgi:hypothetical protein
VAHLLDPARSVPGFLKRFGLHIPGEPDLTRRHADLPREITERKRMKFTRRGLLERALLGGAAAALGPRLGAAQSPALNTKPIPRTVESLPVIGLGTWFTFNVGADPKLLDECAAVMAVYRGRRTHDRLFADVRIGTAQRVSR